MANVEKMDNYDLMCLCLSVILSFCSAIGVDPKMQVHSTEGRYRAFFKTWKKSLCVSSLSNNPKHSEHIISAVNIHSQRQDDIIDVQITCRLITMHIPSSLFHSYSQTYTGVSTVPLQTDCMDQFHDQYSKHTDIGINH